jgi:SAM-dependent methyltransferase
MKSINPAGFEQKFRQNIDPWNYTRSPFEHFKRNVLLRACGCRTYGRGLELACAIGETTRYLSRRCLRLLAVDSSPTALAEAKRRLRGNSKVSFRLTMLPEQMPHGPFDLIVASEIVYYLSPHALDELLRRLHAAAAPNGRIVILDHTRPFDDAAQPPARAHDVTRLKLQKTMETVFRERHRRFEVVSFRKRARC